MEVVKKDAENIKGVDEKTMQNEQSRGNLQTRDKGSRVQSGIKGKGN